MSKKHQQRTRDQILVHRLTMFSGLPVQPVKVSNKFIPSYGDNKKLRREARRQQRSGEMFSS